MTECNYATAYRELVARYNELVLAAADHLGIDREEVEPR